MRPSSFINLDKSYTVVIMLGKQNGSANPFSSWVEERIRAYTRPVLIDQAMTLMASDLLENLALIRDKFAYLAGKVVLLQENNTSALFTHLLALSQIGAVTAPISINLAGGEINRIAQITGAFAIIRSGMLEMLGGQSRVTLEPPAFIRFTSGTTGSSRGVCISGTKARQRAESFAKGLALSSSDCVLWLLPLEHHFVTALFGVLSAGATLRFNGSRGSHGCVDCTVIYGAPEHLRLLVRAQPPAGFKSLRLAIATTAAISEHDCAEFLSVYGVPVSRVYGAIEIGVPLGNINAASALPGSFGYPLPGYEVKICRDDYDGQLAFRGNGIFDGYIGDTQSPLSDHSWYVSGDVAEELVDGSFRIRGRASSAIRIGGVRIFPEEIEALLSLYSGIREARVFGERALSGEVLVAAEVVAEDGVSLDSAQLIEFCKARLGEQISPQRIDIVDSIGKTVTGKIRR